MKVFNNWIAPMLFLAMIWFIAILCVGKEKADKIPAEESATETIEDVSVEQVTIDFVMEDQEQIFEVETETEVVVHEETTEVETSTEIVETSTEIQTVPEWKPYDFIPLSYDVQYGIKDACDRYDLDYDFILALFKQESNFNQSSIGDGGKAYGLGQIREEYWDSKACELGLYDWRTNPIQNAEMTCYIIGRQMNDNNQTMENALNIYRSGTTNDTIEPNGLTYVQIIKNNINWIYEMKEN